MAAKIIIGLFLLGIVLLTSCQSAVPKTEVSSEEAEINAGLGELKELEDQGKELDDLSFEEVEDMQIE